MNAPLSLISENLKNIALFLKNRSNDQAFTQIVEKIKNN